MKLQYKLSRIFLCLITVFSFFAKAQSQTTVSFQPNGSVGIDALVQNYNYSTTNKSDLNFGTYVSITSAYNKIGTSPYAYRSFIAFDLSSIPLNATVVSANLTLTGTGHTGLGSNASFFQRVTSPWAESTITWNNQSTATTSGQISLAASTTSTQIYVLDVKTHVQDMIQSPQSNFGWMLIKQIDGPTLSSLVFASSDYGIASKRPKLDITYFILSASANVTICSASPTTLSASGATSYTWAPAASLSASTGSSVTASPTITTTYTVTGTSGGVSSTKTIAVTVKPLPDVSATAATFISTFQTGPECMDTYIANGVDSYSNFGSDSYILSGNYGYNYRGLIKFDLSSIPSNAIIIYANFTLFELYYTGINAAYLQKVTSGWDEYGVTWNNQPTTDTTGQIRFNQSQNYIMDVKTYVQNMIQNPQSNFGWMLKPQNETTGGYLAFHSRNNSQNYRNPKLEIAYILPNANSVVCKGNTISLLASGATAYTWMPTTFLNSSTIPNVISTPTTDITYTVTGTGTNGCSATKTLPLTVVVNPGLLFSTSTYPSSTLCLGQSATISTNASVNTYTWLPSSGLTSSTGNSVIATPITTTTYTVTGIDVNGCSNETTVALTVNALPLVSATSSFSAICLGQSSTLSTSGAMTYTWSPATTLNSSTNSSVIATPTSNTTYTVIGLGANGCSKAAIVALTVHSMMTANTMNTSICSGQSSTLTASGASTYTWSPDNNLNVNTGATVIANNITATTTFTVTGNCSSQAFVTVNIDPLLLANAGNDVAVVTGNNTAIGGSSSASGGTSPYSYSWMPSTGLNSGLLANPIASPLLTTSYTLTVTDAFACSAKDAIIVRIKGKSYVALRETANTGFYQTNNGKLDFSYNEEYQSSGTNLNFKIYIRPSEVLVSGATVQLPVVYGENRYSLDVSTLTTLTTGKVYTLEVSNAKKESWFLKFQK